MQFISICVDAQDEVIKDVLTKFAADIKFAGAPII